MIEQFQSVLRSPKMSNQQLLKKSQDYILNALELIFPPEYDFSQLAKIYENKDISNNTFQLTYHLIKYFIQIVSENFVSIHSYSALQQQTQKLESTIRSHIKLEQEVKMYLEHLESKILKYQHYIQHYVKNNKQQYRKSFDQQRPNTKEISLMKERLSLIRRNEVLSRRLAEKQNELKRYNEMGFQRLDILENFRQKDKLILSKSEQKLENLKNSQANRQIKKDYNSILKLKTPINDEKGIEVININGNHYQINSIRFN